MSYFRRWVADDKDATSNSLTLGPVSLYLCFSATNHHGTQKAGNAWNQQTVTGPKFIYIKLKRESAGLSHRFIFYLRSGAWYHFDVYVTFSRKYKTNAGWIRSLKHKLRRLP